LAARLPDRRVTILLLALLIEAVYLGDLAGLVVASDEGDLVGVPLAMLDAFMGCVVECTYMAFKHISKVNVSKLK
jgi:hypothetical protein